MATERETYAGLVRHCIERLPVEVRDRDRADLLARAEDGHRWAQAMLVAVDMLALAAQLSPTKGRQRAEPAPFAAYRRAAMRRRELQLEAAWAATAEWSGATPRSWLEMLAAKYGIVQDAIARGASPEDAITGLIDRFAENDRREGITPTEGEPERFADVVHELLAFGYGPSKTKSPTTLRLVGPEKKKDRSQKLDIAIQAYLGAVAGPTPPPLKTVARLRKEIFGTAETKANANGRKSSRSSGRHT